MTVKELVTEQLRSRERILTMSSKKRNEEQKRVTSITRKLHWSWIRRKLAGFLVMDAFFYILILVLWCLDQEYMSTGGPVTGAARIFEGNADAGGLVYVVKDAAGIQVVQSPVLPMLIIVSIIFAVTAGLQLFSVILSFMREDRQIRRILAPINEIALKADELSRFSFSEDKYHVIEDAIDNIQPGEETPLAFHDSDLGGIEAAMNNLLLRMRESYRQQARFVNDASHELRTPIAVIQGYANMLDRWGKTDEKILDESITAIRNEATHMGYLVEQLLFLARDDSGRTVLNPQRIRLDELLQEVYEECVLIDETHHYLIRKTDREIPVTADQGLLKQAVRILTDNASKYTPAGKDITLSCGLANDGPWIQVQDSGIGMSSDDVRHMFERFYRSDEVRAYAGTGLGLSIAKWIVDRHRGHFEILSRTELGTRVRICLPDDFTGGT